MANGKLYVIFHGSWAFVDNLTSKPNDPIKAYAPDIKNHTPIAGTFMKETQVPPGAILTLNVNPAIQARDGVLGLGDDMWSHKDQMVMFPQLAGCPPAGLAFQYMVNLPRPTLIRAEQVVDNVGVVFAPGEATQTLKLCLVPVFEYNLGDAPPSVSSADGSYNWVPDPAALVPLTLHFWSADAVDKTMTPDSDCGEVGKFVGFPEAQITEATMSYTAVPGVVGIPDLNNSARATEITQYLYQRLPPAPGAQVRPRGTVAKWLRPVPFTIDIASCGGGGGGS